MGFRQRAAEDGEILAEHIDLPAVDRAPAGDHPVAVKLLLLHPEVDATVGLEHVELFEAALVEQDFDPFAGGQLALGVLGVDAFLATAKARLGAAVLEFLQDILHESPLPGFRRKIEKTAPDTKHNSANLQIFSRATEANCKFGKSP